MPIISLCGAKGGVGTSLIAANLAVRLAASKRSLLLDLNPVAGGLDLLLGQSPSKSWADLLPVADELTDRHLELATTGGIERLGLLAAPRQPVDADPTPLISSLATRCHWLVLDMGARSSQFQLKLLAASDAVLLVTTLDPPALRASERWLASNRGESQAAVSLVVNQWTASHPVDPKSLAESLEIELAAVFPYAPQEVSEQVNFGRPIAGQPRSGYGRALRRLVRRLQSLEPVEMVSNSG